MDERQMENAEHDGVDEKSASLVVEGSGPERWVVCLDDEFETETGTNEKPGVSESEDHDVDVVEGAKDCVVVHDGDGGTWRGAPMEPDEKQVMDGVQKYRLVMDKDWKSPEGGQASDRPEWMEKSMGVVVVVPEPVEEALTMEEVVSRLMVLKVEVLMLVAVWTPEVAVHEMHEGPLHDVDGLRHEGHGPMRSASLRFPRPSSSTRHWCLERKHLWSETVEDLWMEW